MLRNAVVRHCLIDEEWWKLFELLSQLSGDFDVHFRKPEPHACSHFPCKIFRSLLWFIVVRNSLFAARHFLEHRAWVEGVRIEVEDVLRDSRQVVFVRGMLFSPRTCLQVNTRLGPPTTASFSMA